MSLNCSDPNIVGCVESDMALGLASFNSLTGGCVALLILFVTYHGFMNLAGANTFYELMMNLWYGVTAFSGKAWKLAGSAKEQHDLGKIETESTGIQRLIYIISAATVVIMGWYLAEDIGFSIMLFSVVFICVFLIYTSGRVEARIVEPLVGGLLLGLMLAAIMWASRFFKVRSFNTFGDTLAVVLSVYLFMGCLAWYGHSIRRRPGRRAGLVKDGAFGGRGQKITLTLGGDGDGRRKTGPKSMT